MKKVGHTHVPVQYEKSTTDIPATLRTAGFRVTQARRLLLALLESADTPLTIQQVRERWLGPKPDVTTLYRSLTDLYEAGIVKRVALGTGAVHYEFTPHRPHHHHIICARCGVVEELEGCALRGVENDLLVHSATFTTIFSHNLEFIGECTDCVTLQQHIL